MNNESTKISYSTLSAISFSYILHFPIFIFPPSLLELQHMTILQALLLAIYRDLLFVFLGKPATEFALALSIHSLQGRSLRTCAGDAAHSRSFFPTFLFGFLLFSFSGAKRRGMSRSQARKNDRGWGPDSERKWGCIQKTRRTRQWMGMGAGAVLRSGF